MPKWLRLGIYDPDPEDDDVRFVGDAWSDTPENRREALRSIREYNEAAEVDEELTCVVGVFPVAIRSRQRKATN